jgi:hypothetical protein
MTKQKNELLVGIVLAACLSYCACTAGQSETGGASRAQTNQVSRERTDMKVRIKIGEKEVTATLKDSETARDFISLLPLTLTLEDHARTEKISDLPRRLSTDGAPSGSDPDVGDIAYYAPWGNLAIYYKDFGYSDGLIILGKIGGGVEAFNVPGSVKATIELVK